MTLDQFLDRAYAHSDDIPVYGDLAILAKAIRTELEQKADKGDIVVTERVVNSPPKNIEPAKSEDKAGAANNSIPHIAVSPVPAMVEHAVITDYKERLTAAIMKQVGDGWHHSMVDTIIDLIDETD